MLTTIIITTLLKGLLIGLISSAPTGPVGVLCVRRTLQMGRATGIYTGIGAMISDLLYASLSFWGVGVVMNFLDANRLIFIILGTLFFLLFGFFLLRQPTRYREVQDKNSATVSPLKTIGSALVFTLYNPLIIFFFVAFFARFNIPHQALPLYISYPVVLAGIGFGSMAWWILLTYLVHHAGKRASVHSIRNFNMLMAYVFIGIGIVGVIRLLIKFIPLL